MARPVIGDKVKFYVNEDEACTEVRGMACSDAYLTAIVVYEEGGLVNLQVLDNAAAAHACQGVAFVDAEEPSRPDGECFCTA